MKYLSITVVRGLVIAVTAIFVVLLVLEVQNGAPLLEAIREFLFFGLLIGLVYMVYVGTVVWYHERMDKIEKNSQLYLDRQSKEITNTVQLVKDDQQALGKDLAQVLYEITKDLGMQISHVTKDLEALRGEIETSLEGQNNQLRLLDSKLNGDISLASIESLLNKTYSRLDGLGSVNAFINPIVPLPIMHEWTISSDYALQLILSWFKLPQKQVVDLGSGISSLILGYMAAKTGEGHVVALEDDIHYYEKTKELVELHRLGNFVDVYYCPLREYEIAGEKWMWYDVTNVPFLNITLVSVDGPPGSVQKLSRYPALPLLDANLDPGSVILLDDGDRPDEKKIARMWAESFSLRLEHIIGYKGIQLMQKPFVHDKK